MMRLGIPYDSEVGRYLAASLTSLLSAAAYYNSAQVAENLGPFQGYNVNGNSTSMMDVMRMHSNEANKLISDLSNYALKSNSAHIVNALNIAKLLAQLSSTKWIHACSMGEVYGFRNSQISVLAPTGTIGLLMDCDTTGIEPDFSLVKYKKLAGGGSVRIINTSLKGALISLGYTEKEIADIIAYVLGTCQIPNNIKHVLLEKQICTDTTLAKVENALIGAFSLESAFNKNTIGNTLVNLFDIQFDKNGSLSKEVLNHVLGITVGELNKLSEVILVRASSSRALELNRDQLQVVLQLVNASIDEALQKGINQIKLSVTKAIEEEKEAIESKYEHDVVVD
jgi:ribonucleoside-diphosphate reductase alpha chain